MPADAGCSSRVYTTVPPPARSSIRLATSSSCEDPPSPGGRGRRSSTPPGSLIHAGADERDRTVSPPRAHEAAEKKIHERDDITQGTEALPQGNKRGVSRRPRDGAAGSIEHLHVGVPETVDRLLRIPDDDQIAGGEILKKGEQYLELERVRVLVFVHHHDSGIARPAPRGPPRCQKEAHFQLEVVEIETRILLFAPGDSSRRPPVRARGVSAHLPEQIPVQGGERAGQDRVDERIEESSPSRRSSPQFLTSRPASSDSPRNLF